MIFFLGGQLLSFYFAVNNNPRLIHQNEKNIETKNSFYKLVNIASPEDWLKLLVQQLKNPDEADRYLRWICSQ